MGTISLQIPALGSPNAIEDPKIISDFTALQTLLNGNIDRNNLSSGAVVVPGSGLDGLTQRICGSSVSVVVGTIAYATPGLTITLPTPTAPDQLVGVFAIGPVSGSSPVTVQMPAGVIVPLSTGVSATSFLLGTSNSGVILRSYSAIEYLIESGQQDTGWVGLSLQPNYASIVTPACRLIGDRVWLQGGVNSGVGSSSVPFVLPTFARPSTTRAFATYSSGLTNGSVGGSVGSSGNVSLANTVDGGAVYFDDVSFAL